MVRSRTKATEYQYTLWFGLVYFFIHSVTHVRFDTSLTVYNLHITTQLIICGHPTSKIEGVPITTESGISLISWLAGGPLRVATIRRTTDTHYRHIPLRFSHNERTLVQSSLRKEMPGSVASGTFYILNNDTLFKGQLEVELVTTSRYMCIYINISKC
jgi:hypothetical protein